jgi:hypothetical protein
MNVSSPSWRTLLPASWLPILSDAMVLIAILVFSFAFGPVAPDSPYSLPAGVAGAFLYASVPVFIMFVAMTRAPIWLRLLLIFGPALMLLAAASLLKNPHLPFVQSLKAALVDFQDELPDFVRAFAAMALIAHLPASLLGVHISANTPSTAQSQMPIRSSIKDWLYLMLLIGLALMPDPVIIQSGAQSIVSAWLNDIFASLAFFFMVASLTMVAGGQIVGMILLTPWKLWRFQCAALLCLTILFGAASAVLAYEFKDVLAGVSLFGMFALSTLASAPHWLMLRWAGYRLHFQRHWILG